MSNPDVLRYVYCGAGCDIITMSPKHVIFKKVSRDKSVSWGYCCCCFTPAAKWFPRWFGGVQSLTLSTVFQVAVYMGKRDFVDHCDFVDPVGERSIYSLFWN